MNKFLKMFGVSSQDEKKLNRLYDDCVKIGIEPKVVAPFSFGIQELVYDAIRELHILIGNELNSTLVYNFIKNGIEPVVKTLEDELRKLDKQ